MPSRQPDLTEPNGNESDGTLLRTQLRTEVDETDGTKLRPEPDAPEGTQLRTAVHGTQLPETRAVAKPGDTIVHPDTETELSTSHDMTLFELAQPPVALSKGSVIKG